jgi:beta-N-acetylhexosaminidase
MVDAAISEHTRTAETVRVLAAQLTGRSAFRGTHNENVWCGAWDTRR